MHPRYAVTMSSALIDALKVRISEAVKAKDEAARDVLRLALGEVQTGEARASRPLTDDEIVAILRKLVKSNEETIAASGEGDRATTLRHEIEVISVLLPKTLSVAAITEALASQRDAIKAARADGQATGLAIKHLKSTGAVFEGNDVTTAVKAMRA